MLYLAFFIFVIVFLGGLLLAYRHFQEDDVPLALAMGHGAGGCWDWSFSISRPAAWGPRPCGWLLDSMFWLPWGAAA